MKKTKILFTIPNFDTAGSGRHMVDIVKRLDTNVFEPHIACEHSRGAFFKEVERTGIPIHIRKSTNAFEQKREFIGRVFKNFMFFRKHRFDMIHSFHWASDLAEPLGARLAGKKWLYTKKNMTWARKAWQVRTNLASHIVIINPYLKDMYYSKNDNVTRIGLGVQFDEWKSPEKETTQQLKADLGITPDMQVIGTVANLVPVKGVHVLIKAFKLYLDAGTEAVLLIVGEDNTDYGRELHQLVSDLGIKDKVHFTGKTMDVQSHLALIDLYVQPTVVLETATEALGVATIEAIVGGKLSIGSDVAGTRFVLGEGSGFLFEQENEEELLEKIKTLSNISDEEKEQLIQKQRKRVEEVFNLLTIVQDYEKIYKGLVAN